MDRNNWIAVAIAVAAFGGVYYFASRPAFRFRQHLIDNSNYVAAQWNRQIELFEQQNALLDRIASALEAHQKANTE
jgi:hypothetical protein